MAVVNFTTEADLQILQEAIVSGEKSSKHQDRTVVYRDLDEMLIIEARTKKALLEAESPTRKPRSAFRLCVNSGL